MARSESTAEENPQQLSTFARVVGAILGVSYPVLALSTGARGIYQLFFKDGADGYLAPALTTVAALLYLVAAVGFTIRTKWAWRVSVVALTIETVMVVLVGSLSIWQPDLFGRTAWSYFGADYAFFPLIQPLLGLGWLLHPETLAAFDIESPWQRK